MNEISSQVNYGNFSEVLLDEVKSLMPVLQSQILHGPLTRYPEDRFRQYFMPYFLGLIPAPTDLNLYAVWSSEVGSLHSEVEIYDSSNPTKTLFNVPPLMNMDGIDLAKTPSRSVRFSKINQVFEEESRNFPTLAASDYYTGLGQKLLSTFSINKAVPNAIEKWIAIFNYYQIPLPTMDQPNGSAGNTTTQPPLIGNDWSNIGELDFNPSFE